MKNVYALLTIAALMVFGCSTNDNPTATSAQELTKAPSQIQTKTPAQPVELPAPDGDPVVTVTASQTEIFPPNKKMVIVVFNGTLANYLSASYQLTDEYGKISYSGTLTGSSFSIPLELKAERHGKDKDGRTYTFTVTADNQTTVSASVTVVVLHDKKDKDHDGDDDDDDDNDDGHD